MMRTRNRYNLSLIKRAFSNTKKFTIIYNFSNITARDTILNCHFCVPFLASFKIQIRKNK